MKAVIKYELIGSHAEIVDSTNKSNIGIKGKIIDETKDTIVIEQKNKRSKKGLEKTKTFQKQKRLFKNNITLIIKINNQKYKIKGNLLAKRPKDRLKCLCVK